MLSIPVGLIDGTWFQSTPLVAEGRCGGRGWYIPRGRLFQSTPLVAEGRCLDSIGNPVSPLTVSIHAPRCRGAMHLFSDHHCNLLEVSIHAPRCRGAMRVHTDASTYSPSVSIHAPRCRGAMPASAALSAASWRVSIHAPRCRGAMPDNRQHQRIGPMFQSTPLVAEGRCAYCRDLLGANPCFNPRPSLPRGDARGQAGGG